MCKKLCVISLMCILPFLPFVAHAEININNHTDFFGTGEINGSCSSSLGDSGIIKPHGKMTLTKAQIIALCGFSNCDAKLFLTNNCSGDKLATVTLSQSGIHHIINHKPDEFDVSGNTSNITISKRKALFMKFKKFWKWFF